MKTYVKSKQGTVAEVIAINAKLDQSDGVGELTVLVRGVEKSVLSSAVSKWWTEPELTVGCTVDTPQGRGKILKVDSDIDYGVLVRDLPNPACVSQFSPLEITLL